MWPMSDINSIAQQKCPGGAKSIGWVNVNNHISIYELLVTHDNCHDQMIS